MRPNCLTIYNWTIWKTSLLLWLPTAPYTTYLDSSHAGCVDMSANLSQLKEAVAQNFGTFTELFSAVLVIILESKWILQSI